jgi:hypothetical protein
MRVFIFAIVLLGAEGCHAMYGVRPGTLAPATAAVPPAERIALWHRSVSVLLEEGYVPQVLNEAACYVSGKQRDDVAHGALAGTMAIVTIAPEGSLRVEVSGVGLYESPEDLGTDISKRQIHLMRRILNQPEPIPPPPRPAPSQSDAQSMWLK